MPFFKELQNPVLIPILAATRIREDREQLKGLSNQDKLANLNFSIQYINGKDILLIDDILTTGDSFVQMKRKLMELGASSVIGLFFGKTVKR